MNETAYYWIGGIGAWIITLWMAKRYVQATIFDVVAEAKTISEKVEQSVINLELTLTKTKFELKEEMLAQTVKMSKLFNECVVLAKDAQLNAQEAKDLFRLKKAVPSKKNGYAKE